MHVQLSSEARGQNVKLCFPLLPFFVYMNSEGSGRITHAQPPPYCYTTKISYAGWYSGPMFQSRNDIINSDWDLLSGGLKMVSRSPKSNQLTGMRLCQPVLVTTGLQIRVCN